MRSSSLWLMATLILTTSTVSSLDLIVQKLHRKYTTFSSSEPCPNGCSGTDCLATYNLFVSDICMSDGLFNSLEYYAQTDAANSDICTNVYTSIADEKCVDDQEQCLLPITTGSCTSSGSEWEIYRDYCREFNGPFGQYKTPLVRVQQFPNQNACMQNRGSLDRLVPLDDTLCHQTAVGSSQGSRIAGSAKTYCQEENGALVVESFADGQCLETAGVQFQRDEAGTQCTNAVLLGSVAFFRLAEPCTAPKIFCKDLSETSLGNKLSFTTTPAPAPGNGGGGATFCFSGETTVETKDRGVIRMRDLQLQDEILVSGQRFEPVYSFGHFQKDAKGDFLRFQPSNLEISKNHLIFVSNRESFVPASTVQVGDELQLADGSTTKVTAIQTMTRRGLYAPFTPSGQLLVNDVLVSSYVSMQEDNENLQIGTWKTPISHQWLGYSFESVHRSYCRVWDCQTETYTNEGLSTWIATAHTGFAWLLQQSSWMQVVVLLPYLAVMLLVTHPMTLFLAALLLCLQMTNRRIRFAVVAATTRKQPPRH